MSYITDKYQTVDTKGEKSQLRLVGYGIPQDSILGPILFILYINDITDYINPKHITCVDDTCSMTSILQK